MVRCHSVIKFCEPLNLSKIFACIIYRKNVGLTVLELIIFYNYFLQSLVVNKTIYFEPQSISIGHGKCIIPAEQ